MIGQIFALTDQHYLLKRHFLEVRQENLTQCIDILYIILDSKYGGRNPLLTHTLLLQARQTCL